MKTARGVASIPPLLLAVVIVWSALLVLLTAWGLRDLSDWIAGARRAA